MKSHNMRDGKRKKKVILDYIVDSNGNQHVPPELNEISLYFILTERAGGYNNLTFIMEFMGERYDFYVTTTMGIHEKPRLLERASTFFCYRMYGFKLPRKQKMSKAVDLVYNKWLKSDAWDERLREIDELLEVHKVMSE